jgi:hypothetical protein
MRTVKGMVQVVDCTYRIVRLEKGIYEAVRILDDVRVGSFSGALGVAVTPYCIERGLMEAIARAAIHGGKTSWTGVAVV